MLINVVFKFGRSRWVWMVPYIVSYMINSLGDVRRTCDVESGNMVSYLLVRRHIIDP